MASDGYDRRFLTGVLLFNAGDFFEAHESWEDLWSESTGPERRFYQGLIQAAVGLCHFCNGNLRGAVKLYHTSRAYMDGLPPRFLGVDVPAFWESMAACFRAIVSETPDRDARPEEALLPVLVLDPPPAVWPELTAAGSDEPEEP